ncbi:MAG: TonB-dependent receptor [Myxococcales bacterium FL481]|nr:MAG: TonB-dependent receptor [Myxococcales bacterium FL481]
MRLHPRILLGVCAAQLCIVAAADADQGLAVITGTVTNTANGQPVEGVVVVAASNALQGEATVTTDRSGHFRLPSLPPGEYRIEVLGNGFQPYERPGIMLRAGTTIRANPQLVPTGGDVREIEVAAPTVDVGSTSTGVVLGEDFSKRVPIVGPGSRGSAQRSFEGVAEATPGARGDDYGTSVSGTTSPENQYLIDGVSVGHAGFGTNGLALSSEFVSDVNVISGGYMPEYGRASGGIISAVTKSGSNEFHGGVWGFFAPGGLEGKPKTLERRDGTIAGDRQLGLIGDIGFDIGGPIIKDKLWFYVGFDVARTRMELNRRWTRIVTGSDGRPELDEDDEALRETISGSEEQFDATLTEYQSLAKLTYTASEQHRITLSGTFAPRRSGGDGTASIDARSGIPDGILNSTFDNAAGTRHGYAATGVIKWNASSKDKKWTFDTMVSWNRLRTTRLPLDGTEPGSGEGLAGIPSIRWGGGRNLASIVPMPAGADQNACNPVAIEGEDAETIVCPSPAGGFFTGGPGWIFDRRSTVYAAGHTATFVLNALGHHVFKFGADGNYVDYTTSRAYSGEASFAEMGVPDDGPPIWLTRRRYGYLTEVDNPVHLESFDRQSFSYTIGGFVQDSWNIADKVTLNIGGRYDFQQVHRADGSVLLSLPNQISPRAGLIYDFTGDGRSKVFANYARFYQNVPLGIVDRLGSGEPQMLAFYECEDPIVDVAACYDNIIPADDGDQFSDGYLDTPSHVHAMRGAGTMAVDPDIKPPSTDEIVAGAEYEILPRARLGAAYSRRWLNNLIEDVSRDEGNTYFLANPGRGIASDFPEAVREYDAVNVYFQRGFHKNWQLMASYTLSWLRGNIAGLYRPSTNQLDPFANSDFDLQSLLDNRTGPLSGDQRHVVRTFASGEIPLPANTFITVGGAVSARSGGPTNYLGAHIPYGAGEAFLLERGSGKRLPWVFNIDANLGFGMTFADGIRMRITADVFNLPNLQQTTRIDENYTLDPVLPIVGSSNPADLDGLTTVDDGETRPAIVNPNFRSPTRFQTPRRFRFGLRFEF